MLTASFLSILTCFGYRIEDLEKWFKRHFVKMDQIWHLGVIKISAEKRLTPKDYYIMGWCQSLSNCAKEGS